MLKVFLLILCLSMNSVFAQPVQWKIKDGGNGHYYEVVKADEVISWLDASSSADCLGGYLATVTSEEENEFVFNLIDDLRYWNRYADRNFGPWLGGVLVEDNWSWINEEHFSFSNWHINEPNNEDDLEIYIHYFSGITAEPETSMFWNDQPNFKPDGPISFVVEYESLQE